MLGSEAPSYRPVFQDKLVTVLTAKGDSRNNLNVPQQEAGESAMARASSSCR